MCAFFALQKLSLLWVLPRGPRRANTYVHTYTYSAASIIFLDALVWSSFRLRLFVRSTTDISKHPHPPGFRLTLTSTCLSAQKFPRYTMCLDIPLVMRALAEKGVPHPILVVSHLQQAAASVLLSRLPVLTFSTEVYSFDSGVLQPWSKAGETQDQTHNNNNNNKMIQRITKHSTKRSQFTVNSGQLSYLLCISSQAATVSEVEPRSLCDWWGRRVYTGQQ